MRKVYLFMMVSVDGYFEGPNHDISWHNVDEEFDEFAIQQTGEVGTILFGRVTYEMMAEFWPSDDAINEDPKVAELMNTKPKVVFSKTLEKADWNNTTLVHDNAAEEVKKLKQQTGGDIAIFGSNNLCVSLMRDGLVDEFRVMVNPLLIGNGTRLFEGFKEKLALKLLSTRTFKNGNVLLIYKKD